MTHTELDKLQLGYIVRNEQQNDRVAASTHGNTTDVERTKREHKASIRRRLRDR